MKYTKSFAQIQQKNIFWGLALWVWTPLTIILCSTVTPKVVTAQIIAGQDKALPNLILTTEVSGFVPFRESYRINYQTSLAGLPIEFAVGLHFPVSLSLATVLEFRYKRRTAIFIPDFQIKTVEVEIGVHDYLEKEHQNDLRLFGKAGLLLCRSTASGKIDGSHDGSIVVSSTVSKDYYNIGLGLGLGIEYPLSQISSVYAGVHLSVYFIDKIATGGLGNVGGLSIGFGYQLSL